MHLKWVIPVNIIFFPEPELTIEDFEFEFEKKKVRIFLKDYVKKSEAEAFGYTYSMTSIEKIGISVSDIEGKNRNPISEWIQDKDELIKKILKISNLFLKHLRVVACAPEIREISLKDSQLIPSLKALEVKYSDDLENWLEFDVNALHIYIAGGLQQIVWSITGTAIVNDYYWKLFVDSLINNSIPHMEMEFIVNCKEQLERKNYRLAVIEIAIGFEIVFSGFCHDYFILKKGMKEKQLKDFLTPQFDLSTRLNGIPDMIFTPSELQKLDITSIKRMVGWRNKLVHQKPDILDNQSPDDIKKTIDKAINAIYFLINKRTALLSEA